MQRSAVTRYSTSSVPAAHRLAAWNAAINRVFDSLVVDTPERTFDARLMSRGIGDCTLAVVDSTPARIQRRMMGGYGATKASVIKIHVQDHGRSLDGQDGRTATLGEGEFTVRDGARPYSIEFAAPNRMLVLSIPVDRFVARLGDPERFVGLHLKRNAKSALFTAFLRNLVAMEEDEGELWHKTIPDVLLDLLAVSCEGARSRSEDGEAVAVNPVWHRRLCAYIDEHLTDPSLRTSTLAEAFGVSPRYIQMIFAGKAGTVSAHILRRRLERAAERLRTGAPGGAISDIAFDLGFQDLSYFSRTFRAHFGVSAKEYRAGRRGETEHCA